jgi:hypothetical protein
MYFETRGIVIEPVSKIFSVGISENRKLIIHKCDYGIYALLAVKDFQGVFIGVFKRVPGGVVVIDIPAGRITAKHVLDISGLLVAGPDMATLEVGNHNLNAPVVRHPALHKKIPFVVGCEMPRLNQ